MEYKQFNGYFPQPMSLWGYGEGEARLFEKAVKGIYEDVNSDELTVEQAKQYVEVFRKTSHMQIQIDAIQNQRALNMAFGEKTLERKLPPEFDL